MGGHRALYIEDDPGQREALERDLTRLGYRVRSAGSGPEGLELLASHEFDVVLCDLNMPGMDGLEVLARAQLLRPELPFIILTAHATVDLGVKAIRNGAYHFITKPLMLEEIEVTLEQAVDHARVQQRLERSEELLGTLMDTIPDIIYSLDPDGNFLSVSRGANQLLGYEPEQLLGRSVLSVIHPDDRERIREAIVRSVREREEGIRTVQFRMLTREGEVREFEIRRSLVFAGGEVVRHDGVARDITDRKRLQSDLGERTASLERAQRELQAILDASQAAILMVSPEGRITTHNRTAEQTFGFARGELRELAFEQFLEHAGAHFEAPRRFHELVQQLAHDPEPAHRDGVDHRLIFERVLQLAGKPPRFIATFCEPVADAESGRDLGRIWIFSDVTRIKEADEQLYKIVEVSPVPLVVTRVSDGVVLFANEHLGALVGIPAEELTGKRAPDFYFDPAARDEVMRRLEREGVVKDFEVRLRRADGAPLWAIFSLLLTEISGEPAVIGGVYDITARKQGEDRLKLYREVFMNTSDAITIIDPRGRFIERNPAHRLSSGYPDEEILGQHASMMLGPENARRVFAEVQEHGRFRGELTVHSRAGVRREIDLMVFPIYAASQQLLCYAGMARDITQRIQTERDLARRLRYEEALADCSQALFQGSGDPIRAVLGLLLEASETTVVYTFDNVEDDELGLSMELRHVVARDPELQGPGDEPRRVPFAPHFDRWRELLERGEPVQGVVRDLPDGERRFLRKRGILSVLVLPFCVDGVWRGAIGFDDHEHERDWNEVDVRSLRTAAEMIGVYHERRAVEQELRNKQFQLMQSEKMASLGMLVAGIAHEINTPIGAVGSMHNTLVRSADRLRQVLQEVCPGPYADHKKLGRILRGIDEANQVIASGTERVTTIVRRLRSFARLDEAELKLADLHEGIEDTLTIVHHELKHTVTVRRELGDIPPIPCYPGQLNQVLVNLLINAKQAIEGRGEITIRTCMQGGKVHIAIQDSGAGIPRQVLSRIFDPGFTTKGVGVGTGLGLSICYQIIQDHHGEIRVDSEVGQGSTFSLVLPTDLDRILGVSI